ncbi:MAG: hypothetical protein PHV06_04515 [bacterium]|nr:hypothetical protein [bacterium]
MGSIQIFSGLILSIFIGIIVYILIISCKIKYRNKYNRKRDFIKILISILPALVTLALVFITYGYLIETKSLRKIASEQIAESIKMRELTEERFILESRPYVYIAGFLEMDKKPDKDKPIVKVTSKVKIACIGNSEAKEVKITWVLIDDFKKKIDSDFIIFKQNLYPNQENVYWPFEMSFPSPNKKSTKEDLNHTPERYYLDIYIEYKDRSSKKYKDSFYYWYNITENTIHYVVEREE